MQLMYDCVEAAPIEEVPTVGSMCLTAEDCIVMLERELLVLKKKQVFNGVEITCPAPKHYKAREVPAERSKLVTILPEREPVAQTTKPVLVSRPLNSQHPAHPFANIAEAQYTPPSICNFTVPADKGKEKDQEPAYRTVAPIQNPKLIEEVYE